MLSKSQERQPSLKYFNITKNSQAVVTHCSSPTTHIPQCSSFPLARLSLTEANKLYHCFIAFVCYKSSPFSALQLVYTRFAWQPHWMTVYTSLQRKVKVFPKCQTHSSLFPCDVVPLCYLQSLAKFSTLKTNSYSYSDHSLMLLIPQQW